LLTYRQGDNVKYSSETMDSSSVCSSILKSDLLLLYFSASSSSEVIVICCSLGESVDYEDEYGNNVYLNSSLSSIQSLSVLVYSAIQYSSVLVRISMS